MYPVGKWGGRFGVKKKLRFGICVCDVRVQLFVKSVHSMSWHSTTQTVHEEYNLQPTRKRTPFRCPVYFLPNYYFFFSPAALLVSSNTLFKGSMISTASPTFVEDECNPDSVTTRRLSNSSASTESPAFTPQPGMVTTCS